MINRQSFVCIFLAVTMACWVGQANATQASSSDRAADIQFANPQIDKPEVIVSVLAIRGHLYADQRWQPTIDWLNQKIPEAHFVFKPLDLDGMTKAVQEQSIDFVLTNPGQAVRLGRQYELSWIATVTNRAPNKTNDGIGSALVVRADSSYETLQDVQGLPLAAVSDKAFGGYLTLRYELVQQGINPNDFFADVRYLGFPIDANLYQLRDRNVEAAVVPACLLETMVKEGLLDAGKFRVVNAQPIEHFNCQVSTPLYPNWSMAKTERGSAVLAKKIAQVLLDMPSDAPAAVSAGVSGWTPPVSLLSIDKLYQALDLHPLQQPWWKEAFRWLRFHQEWTWALFIFIVVLNGYHFWLEYRFSKSKKALERTVHRLKEKSEMLEHSQRVAIVGEMGSSVAHEINQPLAAIRNYSEGGLLRVAKQRPVEDIGPIFEKIQGQVERIDAIVSRLRTLIKKRSVDKQDCDVQDIIEDTIELLNFRVQKSSVDLRHTYEGVPKNIVADMVGLQQVLVNVISNALDACVSYQEQSGDHFHAKIDVHTEYTLHGVSIRICDNGTGLIHDDPTSAFVSTKEGGLGLGLAICSDVIEMHNGEFSIASLQPHGCVVEMFFPYEQPTK